ncbi:MAG: bifunctional 4-hydroxy-2-oxoglutarate aldolase/2-dehydro-3-deoxy-phosphogluconate aldolase [Kordiimonadaceae bacterium]|nr:bifunctional 4-hydroxy-2-oxoglutarate aldolase/2-dehydro-3-deoxy-phosphogluconate aldolase [Kordiimonadaceae bacterium]
MVSIRDVMTAGPVIPVLSFKNTEEAVSVCEVLYEEGLHVLEITLRHEAALDAISAVENALPKDAMVGAGTVLTPELAIQARDAGAAFGVSPGLTVDLAKAVKIMKWPFLPGISTLSEAMNARELGFRHLKLFPAELSGGPAVLKAIGSVMPDLIFCPTGGVSAATVKSYLELKNVATVGGSWITGRGTDGTIDLALVQQRAKAIFS